MSIRKSPCILKRVIRITVAGNPAFEIDIINVDNDNELMKNKHMIYIPYLFLDFAYGRNKVIHDIPFLNFSIINGNTCLYINSKDQLYINNNHSSMGTYTVKINLYLKSNFILTTFCDAN